MWRKFEEMCNIFEIVMTYEWKGESCTKWIEAIIENRLMAKGKDTEKKDKEE